VLWVGVLLIGAGIGTLIAVTRSSGKPVAKAPPPDKGFTWAAGAKRAPNFNLVDENGRPVSLGGFRGHPVLITFMDPVCRNLCPLEAKVLTSAVSSLPAGQRPAIISVSVNRWADGRRALLHASSKWKVSSDWHWAVGRPAALSGVWRAYGIGVQDTKKPAGGVATHDVTHTEATYVVDKHGYERALFMYPFLPEDVRHAVERLG
jgi:cytochrome oxidase Cu insertion factor (SCO1/SenC/PrrC family)